MSKTSIPLLLTPENCRSLAESAPENWTSTVNSLGLVPAGYHLRHQSLPVMPAGFFSESDDADMFEQLFGKSWSFQSLPKWTNLISKTLSTTSGGIKIVDLGSSLPILARQIEGDSFERARQKAIDMLTRFLRGTLHEDVVEACGVPETVILEALGSYLGPKREFRPLIHGALQRTLYCLESKDLEHSTPDEVLERHILYELLTAHNTYSLVQDKSYEGNRNLQVEKHRVAEGLIGLIAGIQIRTPDAIERAQLLKAAEIQLDDLKDDRRTEQLRRMRQKQELGKYIGSMLIGNMAQSLARNMTEAGLTRPFSVISVDRAPTIELKSDSTRSFDARARNSGLFKRATEALDKPNKHVVSDILSYLSKQGDSTITHMMSIDSFLSHSGPQPDETAEEKTARLDTIRQTMHQIVRVLVPQGRFVCIPMNVQGNDPETTMFVDKVLEEILNGGEVRVNTALYTRLQLELFMGQADTTAATLSGTMDSALEGTSFFRVLEIEKVPKGRRALPTIRAAS